MKNQNNTKKPHRRMFGGTRKWWGPRGLTHEERRRGLTPFILLPAHFTSRPHPSSLRGEGLNFFGFAEKVLDAPQLPSRSSSRVGAERWDERGRRRTGQVGAPFFSETHHFNLFFIKHHQPNRKPQSSLNEVFLKSNGRKSNGLFVKSWKET